MSYGKKVTLTLFGESHGEGIGAVVEGLPCGEVIDLVEVQRQLSRRAPGGNSLGTPRSETDQVEVMSGLFEGKVTGAPICGVIRNNNTRSRDYTPHLPRPSHADYAAHIKYKGCADYRGGGHFSGRITAGVVFAGSMASQILARRGIYVGAHVTRIESVTDRSFEETDLTHEKFLDLQQSDLPVLTPEKETLMREAILSAKQEGDSVGGIIESAVIGVPSGVGAPFFDSVESRISAMLFGIPAVKGISFGGGFDLCAKRGSQSNDSIITTPNGIATQTNNNGGITGGITNGMPIIVTTAIKPTPSISCEQSTVNIESGEQEKFSIKGRHDPCILPRAICVVEAAIALVILDLLEE
ncbi:MAG: chorismate synthase [Eubacteriales bacterium]